MNWKTLHAGARGISYAEMKIVALVNLWNLPHDTIADVAASSPTSDQVLLFSIFLVQIMIFD